MKKRISVVLAILFAAVLIPAPAGAATPPTPRIYLLLGRGTDSVPDGHYYRASEVKLILAEVHMEEGDTEIFPTGLGVSYAVDCNPKMQIDEPPLDPTDPAYSDESEKARDKGYTLFCSLPGRELSGKKGWTKIIANFHTSRLVYQNWQWQRRAVIIPVTIWIYVVPENK